MGRRHRASTISSDKRAQPVLPQQATTAAAAAPHHRGHAPHGRSSGPAPAPTKPTRASWLRTEGALRQAACEGLRTLKAALAAAATAYTSEELRIMLAVNGAVRKQCCSLDGAVSESAECGVTGVFVTAEDGYDAALNSFKLLRLDAGVGGKYAKARREASALHVAVVLQHWDVVRHLVEVYGCSVHDPAACGASALQMAATNRTARHLVPLLSAEELSAVSPRHGGTRQPLVTGDDGDDESPFDTPQPPHTSARRSSAFATAAARAASASASKPCNPLKDRAFLAGTASAGDVAQADDAATGGGVMSRPSDIAVQYLGRSASDPFGGGSGGGGSGVSRGMRRPRPPTASSFVLRRHPGGGGGDAAPAVVPQAHSPPPKPRAKTGERSHKAMLLRYGSVDAPYVQSVVSEGESSSSSDEGEGEGGEDTAAATGGSHNPSATFAASARPASQGRLRQPAPPAASTLPQQPPPPPPPAAVFGRHGSFPSQLQRFPSAQSVASMLSHQRGRGGDEPVDAEDDDVGVSSDDGGYNPLGKTVYAPEFEVQIREEQLRRRLGPKLTSARLKSAQAAGKLAEKRRRHADARATRHSVGSAGGRGGGSRAVKKALAHSPYLTRKIDSFLRGPPEPYSDVAASGVAGTASETSATWQYMCRRDSAGRKRAA